MEKKYFENVGYLTRSDFNDEGDIINPKILKMGKPTLVMMQAGFCGHCVRAKPDFQKFADKAKASKKAFAATISADATEPGEAELKSLYGKIDKSGFRGFPTYVKFDKNGKYVATHEGGRDADSLYTFATGSS